MSTNPAKFVLQHADGTVAHFDAAKGEVALIVVDVQKEFCDPSSWAARGNDTTVQVAENISAFMPQLAQAGVPSRIVYSAPEPLPPSRVDLFKIAPEYPDDMLCKFNNCAFTGTQLQEKLQHQGAKLLLFAGFNTSACMAATLRSLPSGFSACLLEDLTGNDEDANRFGRSLPALQELHGENICIARGQDILLSIAMTREVYLGPAMPELSAHHVRDATRPLRPANPATWLGR